ncbi:MAG: sensor histidine kinase [Bacteroidota bacterium]
MFRPPQPYTHPIAGFRLFIVFFLISFSSRIQGQIPGVFYYDGEDPVDLSGTWNFVPNQFLDLEAILKDSTKCFIEVPGSWNGAYCDSVKLNAAGFGTYYAKINLAEDQRFEDLAILVSEIGTAYRVFFNDEQVGMLGVPGSTKEEEQPKVDRQIYSLPAMAGTEAYLIFHISNHSYSSGGLFYPPTFGNEQVIRVETERYSTIKLLLLGTVIILGIYMFYVYTRIKREKFRLYFAIVCLVLLVHTLTTSDMPMLDIVPNMSWSVLKKLVNISFFLLGASNGIFLMSLLPKYFNQKLIYGLCILSSIAVLFTLIAPVSISTLLMLPTQILTVGIGLYFFERLIRATYDKESGARFLLVGYGLAFITLVNDILVSNFVIGTPQLCHYGMFAYVLHLTVIMAKKYIDALRRNENVAESLLLSNEYLEKSVADRAKKLEVKSELIDAKNKALQEATKEQEDLMAVVAHDLKAPFNQIQELTELVLDKAKLKKDDSSALEMVLKVTGNARRIIENLVFVQGGQHQELVQPTTSLDPKQFFEEKIIAFQSEAKKKNISIEHALSVNSKKMISDESSLDRIIDNLLSNAIKFSPLDSRVAFEMLEEDDAFIFRIKDYGEGFSEDDKQKLFRKFQKLSTKPTAGEMSSGLGLSIVKILVERLKGDIKLYSEKGKGAEFIVKLPKKMVKDLVPSEAK